MTSRMPVIELRGTPRERGQQYGESARDLIGRSLALYREVFARRNGVSWAQMVRWVRRLTPLIEGFSPHLLAEIGGIAEASNCCVEDILVVNSRGEVIHDPAFGEADCDGCTSFALRTDATGDNHVYAGQNWDWLAEARDTVLVVRIVDPPRPTIIMQLEAGQVGRQGANSAGLALQANGLGGRLAAEVGVPQPFLRRCILECGTMRDALDVALSGAGQIPTNLLLAHKDDFVIDIETTPQGGAWLYPSDGIMVHGNHCESGLLPQSVLAKRPQAVDSLYRVDLLRKALTSCRAAEGSSRVRESIAVGLRNHFGLPASICAHADQTAHRADRLETLTSSIIDLTSGEYLMTLGPPCLGEYEALPWNLYDV